MECGGITKNHMKIAYIGAGAGMMYCGACSRDVGFARALSRAGCDVEFLPIYTPVRSDVPPPGKSSVFLGGLSVYLQQMFPLWRHLPDFFDRVLESESLLRAVSHFGIRTKAKGLGAMTVSVLKGLEGNQSKEFRRLLAHIASSSPDVVHLGNSLLSAIAPLLKNESSAKVVCNLQGEDSFIGAFEDPYRTQAAELVKGNCSAIDLFIVPSADYGERIADYLQLDRRRLCVIRTSIEVELYRMERELRTNPLSIGYLSNIVPEKGLDTLVDAFVELVEKGMALYLSIAGRVFEKRYWRSILKKLSTEGLLKRVEYLGEVELKGKRELFEKCGLFCLPSRKNEIRGTVVLEAMASGLPVLVPDSGIYREIVEVTDGGVLFREGELSEKLAELIGEPERLKELSLRARRGVEEHYSLEVVAAELIRYYGGLERRE